MSFMQFREGVTVDVEEVAKVIAHRRGIPVGELTEDEGKRLLNMEDALRIRVKGQDHAIASVSRAIRLSRSGLKNPDKPIGVFLFAGATGSGKTELAKALAGYLFGDEKKLLRAGKSTTSGTPSKAPAARNANRQPPTAERQALIRQNSWRIST
jgi:ATP-dependent Clp protease ATP-binding subunit ClpC